MGIHEREEYSGTPCQGDDLILCQLAVEGFGVSSGTAREGEQVDGIIMI